MNKKVLIVVEKPRKKHLSKRSPRARLLALSKFRISFNQNESDPEMLVPTE